MLNLRKYNFSSNFDRRYQRKIYFLILISEFYFSLNDGKDYLRESHCLQENLEKIKFSKEITNENVEEYIRSVIDCHSCLKEYNKFIDVIKENQELEYFIPKNIFIQEIDRGLYKKIALSIIEELSNINGKIDFWPLLNDAIGNLCSAILDVKQEESFADYKAEFGKLALQIGNKNIKAYDFGEQLEEYKEIGELIFKIANIPTEIKNQNALTTEVEEADVVAMFPPLMRRFQEINIDFLDYLDWGEPSRIGRYFYVSLAIKKANKKGALILLAGDLFRGGSDRKIRENLLKAGLIEGIILLPGLDYWFSGTLCILFFNKETKNEKVFLFDSRDYFKKVKSRMQIEDENLKKVIEIYKEKKEIKTISKYVSVEEILKNESVLTVERYLGSEIELENINFVELSNEINSHHKNAMSERYKSDKILEKLLKKI